MTIIIRIKKINFDQINLILILKKILVTFFLLPTIVQLSGSFDIAFSKTKAISFCALSLALLGNFYLVK